MLYSTLALVFSAGLAAAQTSSGYVPQTSNTNAACSEGVEAIISSCLASTTPQLEGCEANDWSCMCYAQQAINTCYNNCVADSRLFGAQQQEQQWCAAAKAYPSSTSAAVVVQTTLVTANAAGTPAPTQADAAAITTSATSSAVQPSMTGNAGANLMAPAGGMMAILMGAIAFL